MRCLKWAGDSLRVQSVFLKKHWNPTRLVVLSFAVAILAGTLFLMLIGGGSGSTAGGVKLAQGLARSNVLNFIELSKEHGIVEVEPPADWVGRTLMELNVRARHHVTVIAVHQKGTENMTVAPGANYLFSQGDAAVVLGRYEDINRLEER